MLRSFLLKNSHKVLKLAFFMSIFDNFAIFGIFLTDFVTFFSGMLNLYAKCDVSIVAGSVRRYGDVSRLAQNCQLSFESENRRNLPGILGFFSF